MRYIIYNPNSKLTNSQKDNILYLFNNKLKSARELGVIYNISHRQVYSVLKFNKCA